MSATVTPATVVAGQPITVDVVTSHPTATVALIAVQVTGPGGSELGEDGNQCITEPFYKPVDTSTRIDATTTESTLSCTMPTFATNGPWTVTISVDAPTYESASTTTSIDVTRGTDGPSPPLIHMVTAPPATVARGSTFPIEYQIDDVALGPLSIQQPVNFTLLSSEGAMLGVFNCGDQVTTQITPTEIDIASTCTVGADLHAGTYTSSLTVLDLLDFRASTTFAVAVT